MFWVIIAVLITWNIGHILTGIELRLKGRREEQDRERTRVLREFKNEFRKYNERED